MIYNALLFLFVLGMAPRILWQVLHSNKRVPSLKDRFGFPSPIQAGEGWRIWIHAVSLGEMKAAEPLIERLHQSDPKAIMLVTTSTATGHDEALRHLSQIATIRYLPLDFSWTMHRWVEDFRPDLIVFVEGDLWPNLMSAARKFGAKIALVSGKISEKSAKRFRLFPKLSKHLFDLDLVAVQNEEFQSRLATLTDRAIMISGNLKLDVQPAKIDSETILHRFSLRTNQPAITISCTHSPEEKELLETLKPLWKAIPDLVVFLAPRHPERFAEVGSILQQMKIPFCRWTQTRSNELVILVDAMGELPQCYCLSYLTIVAGSFSSQKGGHNVIEPCLYGCPVLFGPYMHAQKELAHIALQENVGRQVSQETLATAVLKWIQSPALVRSNTHRFIEKHRGSADRTYQMILSLLK